MPVALDVFFLALTTSIVLYVYRFAAGGMNLSIFRAVLIAWVVFAARDLLRRRIHLTRRYVPFLAILAAVVVVNAIDFLRLGGQPALRRDIANHLANLCLVALIVAYVDTEAKARALVKAFVVSSVVTTAITLYALAFNHVPLERMLGQFASDVNRGLAYINDDTQFRRATSSFFDPNFYGIYSMLVCASIGWLWLYDAPRRWLSVLFVVNLICLSLTLSRTGLVGLLVALGVIFLLDRRARVFSVVAAVSAVALLFVATAVQSDLYRAQLLDDASAWATNLAGHFSSGGATGPGGQSPGGDVASGAHEARVLKHELVEINQRASDARSLDDRLSYIRRGLAAFRSHPVLGAGSGALVSDESRWSSAHVTYLTWLARYGVVGAGVYAVFLVYPLWAVWRPGRPRSQRVLVTSAIGALAIVYLSYDVFMFFEVQYLFYGLAYAFAVHRPSGTTIA